MKIDIGVIGLGKLGKVRYDILSENRNVGRMYFYDPVELEYCGGKRLNSAADVIKQENVRAVFICTPNNIMKEIVGRAVRAGKHVFCEKPAGVSVRQARVIHKWQIDNPGLIIKFGFNHRYLSHYQRLRKYVREEKFGKLLWIKGVYGKGYDDGFYKTWRADKAQSGGGVLIDQGIHLLDLINDLAGPVKVEHVLMDRVKWKKADVEDNVFVHLRTKEGVPVSFQSSMAHWKHTMRLEVATEKALLVMSGVKSSTRSYGDEELQIYSDWRDNFVEARSEKSNEPDYYTLKKECDEFLRAVSGRGKVKFGTTEDAVNVMNVIENIYKRKIYDFKSRR
jgi:1,5-anhydro-D-fructose reductase (1,5-anhydro-D-mannitol-forming)